MSLGFLSRSMWSMWMIVKHFEVASCLCEIPLCAKWCPELWWWPITTFLWPQQIMFWLWSFAYSWHSGVRLICSLGRQLSVFHITNLGAGNSQGDKSWLNLTDFLPNVSLGTLHILGYPFYGTQISYSWNLARKSQNSKFHHIIAYFRRFCLAITLEGISNSGKDADTRKILLLRDECAKK